MVKYGWKYVFDPTPKNVSKWLLAFRAVLGVVSAAAIIEHAPVWLQLTILGVGAALHELGTLFADVPTKETPDEVS